MNLIDPYILYGLAPTQPVGFNAVDWINTANQIPALPASVLDVFPDNWTYGGGAENVLISYAAGEFRDTLFVDRNGAAAGSLQSTLGITGLRVDDFMFFKMDIRSNAGNIRLFASTAVNGDPNEFGGDLYSITDESITGIHYGVWRIGANTIYPALRTIDSVFHTFSISELSYQNAPIVNQGNGAREEGVVGHWAITGGAAESPNSATNTPPDGWVMQSNVPICRTFDTGAGPRTGLQLFRNGAGAGPANMRYTVACNVGDLIVVNWQRFGGDGNCLVVGRDSSNTGNGFSLNSNVNIEQQRSYIATETQADIFFRGSSSNQTRVDMFDFVIMIIPAAALA